MAYKITIKNGSSSSVIHDGSIPDGDRVFGAKITEQVNAIPCFEFTINPESPAFKSGINQLTTKVVARDLKATADIFIGRVLAITDSMGEDGSIQKSVTCEGELGYLCDTIQEPSAVTSGTLSTTMLTKIIKAHNDIAGSDKQFSVGTCELMGFPEGCDYDWGNTFDVLRWLFVDCLGGEIRLRYDSGKRYIDFAKQFGDQSETEIRLSENMRSISRSKSVGGLITRLYPLGAIKSDGARLTIAPSGLSGGKAYIEDADLVSKYGVISSVMVYDDIKGEGESLQTAACRLYRKAVSDFSELTKATWSYTVSALDLSTVNSNYDSYALYNSYKVVNPLIGINDYIRVTGRTLNLDEPWLSELTIGERRTSLTGLISRR